MPFYEYQCRACGKLTEVLQKVSDPPLRKCPECGKSQLAKLISAPVFRLKGGGWYETDFKGDSENKRNLVGADKDDAPAKPAAKDDTATAKTEAPAKAEAAPAAKPEPKASSRAATKTKQKAKAKPARAAAKKSRR